MEFAVYALVVGGLLVLMASVVWGTVRTGISPTPSSLSARAHVVGLIAPSPGAVIYDLGSGWGGLGLLLAREFPNSRVVGLEASPFPCFIARLRARWSGASNISFHRADFRRWPVGDATAVVCYLAPAPMEALAVQLRNELPPGVPVVSIYFALPGWEVETERLLGDFYRTPIRRYRSQGRKPGI